MEDRPTPPLNLDPFTHHEVMRATDLRVFMSPLGHWIYTEVTLAKSYFGRIGTLKNQTPQTPKLRSDEICVSRESVNNPS
jgi:hypothetical protein